MQMRAGVAVAALGVLAALTVALIVTMSGRSRPITIGYLNITASLPYFIAEAEGYFADEGIEYEAIPIADSNQLVSGVLARNIDAFPASSIVPVLAAELRSPGRMRVTSVISISDAHPFDALLCRQDAAITTLSDLEGKRIGVFPGSTATTVLRTFLTNEGIDIGTITFVPLPPANQLPALLQGSIDALHAYEPTIALATTRGDVRRIYGSVYAALLPENPQAVAIVSEAFFQERPDEAEAVTRALERGVVFMRENEAEARRILRERMGLEPEVADAIVLMKMLPRNEIDAEALQQWADMLHDLGELDGRVPVGNLLFDE